MKRLIITMLILAAIVFSASAQKTKLSVLYYIDATQAGYDVEKGIWDKFQKDNPDIDLQKEELFGEPFHQKTQAYVAAGKLPDVVYMWPSSRSIVLYKDHLVKDLSVVLGNSYLENFNSIAIDPKSLGESTDPKTQYQAIIPQSFTLTTAVYVNKKLLSDNGFTVPKTYTDLKKMVVKLKSKGVEVAMLPNKDLWPAQSCLFSTISGRYVGNEFIDNVKLGTAKFTDKGFVAALASFQAFYNDGIIARSGNSVGYGEGPGLFATNKAALFIDGDWRGGAYITDKTTGKALIDPTRQENDFEVINLPALPDEKFPGIVSGTAGTGFGISSSIPIGSAKEKAAVRLIKYLYSAEVQAKKLETGAYIPTLKGVKGNVEPLVNKVAAYKNSVKTTGYVLDGVLDASVANILNNGLQALGLGTTNPRAVAEKMQVALDAWLAASKQ